MQKFKLNFQSNLEEIGLHITFIESRIRGSDEKNFECTLQIQEVSEITVTDEWKFSSWEAMKKEYPTLLDLLKDISNSEYWEASWRNNERLIFIEFLEGHTGLYETNQTVYYDMREKN